MKTICALLLSFSIGLFSTSTQFANAQTFDIVSSGELNLSSNLIVKPGKVSKYFGMFVDGLGDSIIKISIGTQTIQKAYTFKLSSTKLSSFLFAQDFVPETSAAFRRGVKGEVIVEILDSAGTLQDTSKINLDVDLGKGNCKKYPSKSLKKCEKLNLDIATNAQKRLLAKRFLNSIKGPIVLEP